MKGYYNKNLEIDFDMYKGYELGIMYVFDPYIDIFDTFQELVDNINLEEKDKYKLSDEMLQKNKSEFFSRSRLNIHYKNNFDSSSYERIDCYSDYDDYEDQDNWESDEGCDEGYSCDECGNVGCPSHPLN